MASAPLDDFVQVSAILTGIAATKLAPPVDPQNIKQVYFDYTKTKQATGLSQLLSIYSANAQKPPASIADIILNQSGEAIRYLARTIMLEWYLGSWYDPAILASYHAANPPSAPPAGTGTVISPQAYTQGWAWSVAQAHPMGYSNLTFGYWAGQPPPLSAYVGGAAK